eukprot:GHVO01057340.1.p1 GENE.GHVO01057340.1~~GHVO01057340.1.p1  ORF type:complete len:544 (+),score=81.18 GHVO01057340.1:49-1680(+)
MTKQTEHHETDDWTLSMAAGTCLGLCAEVLRDYILPKTLEFVNAHFGAQEWQKRDAAVLAYGSIMEGASSQQLAPLLTSSFGALCHSLRDPSTAVRDTTAWTLGRIAQFHTPCIMNLLGSPDSGEGLIALLLQRLTDEPRVAVQICYALNEICSNTGDFDGISSLDVWFVKIAEALLMVIQRGDGDDSSLVTGAYSALCSLILYTGKTEALQNMETILTTMFEWLDRTLASNEVTDEMQQMQASICGVLSVLFIRLHTRCVPIMARSCSQLIRILQAHMSNGIQPLAAEEALCAMAALMRATGTNFQPYLPDFVTLLQTGLKNYEDLSFCGRCTEIVGDLTRSFGPTCHPAIEPLIKELWNLLQSRDVAPALKPKAMFAVGDIALNIGGQFEMYLTPFLELLNRAAQTRVEEGPENNEEWLAYIGSLRDGALAAYSGTIYCLRDCDKLAVLRTHVQSILEFIDLVIDDPHSTSTNIKSALEITSDLVAAFKADLVPTLVSLPIYKKMLVIGMEHKDPGIVRATQWLKEAVTVVQNPNPVPASA